MKKRYCTGTFKLQVLLMQVEDIDVVDMTKTVVGDKVFTNLIFEFEDGTKVSKIIESYKNDKRGLVDKYESLAKRRKQKVNEYFDRKDGDRVEYC